MPSELQAGHSPQGAPNDRELVRRCQAGDSSAFNDLVTRYRSKVFTMVYGMVQNEQDAWDLVQESFLKAWRSIHQFKVQSSFYSWLYRIAINVTTEALRRKGVRGEAEFDDRIAPRNVDPASRTTPLATPPPHRKLEQNEIRQRIDEATGQLSPEHRAVFLMKELEDFQYNEIAEILDCSIGTVMSRLFYARKKLQTLLRHVYEDL
jgi:RNA polymerase sigma-70 factor, ECF subfamily